MAKPEKNSKINARPRTTGMTTLPGNIRVSHENLLITLILMFTFMIYSGTLSHEFLTGWDDGEYLGDPVVRSEGPVNTRAIFSNYYLGMYQPLAMLSFALNFKISGDTAWPYIFINILLHLFNTLLVYRLMQRWMKGLIPAGIVAALFALHPMHVEAVAWISTRSSGLYSLFFLSGLLAWDTYLEKGQQTRHYMVALLFALLALLSKSMAATFPLVLFVIDFMKQRKPGWRLLAEKIPFLALSVIFGLVAVKAAASFGHITVMEQDYPAVQRFFLIIYGLSFYIIKMVVPANLSAIYAFPETVNGSLPGYVYLAAIVPLIVIAGLWFSGKFRREFISGSLFFLFSISMVLPLFWSRIFITADRYSYIPYIGLFMIVARLISNLYESRAGMDKTTFRMLVFTSILASVMLCTATFSRIRTWKDTPTLLTDVIEKRRSDADMAHGYFYLANYYDALENGDEAMKYYDLALSRNNLYLLALNNRGILKGKAGNEAGAISDFEAAIRIKPDYAEAYYNRGVALYQTGKPDEACIDWNRALQLKFKPAGEAIYQYCRKK
ncbi:MAG: tetratricopeptide repeat protein [Bacteroidales bacterium]|nr:tetratricopeptide repeat protein [Bacteroidales bacterium]MBK9356455.1 tetratricopeptide repeat protein [Bacteroidales bacterium]